MKNVKPYTKCAGDTTEELINRNTNWIKNESWLYSNNIVKQQLVTFCNKTHTSETIPREENNT